MLPKRVIAVLLGAIVSIALVGMLLARARLSPRTDPRPAPVPSPTRFGRAVDRADGVAPKFVDIAAEAGLMVPHYNAADGRFRLVETMGSGVGLIDFDGDGWLDIFIAQAAPIPHDPAQP